MAAEADRWDARHRQADDNNRPQACAVLREYRHLLPATGQAVDIACGRGGNALLLAASGLTASAWDYSGVAIGKLRRHAEQLGLPLSTEVRDVTAQPPPQAAFDIIVVCHFLERDLAQPLVAALKPGGLLFYQTFIMDKVTDHGPSNPDYRLAPNELLTLFADLRVVYYREEGRLGNTDQGFRDRAQFIGHKAG